MATNNKYDRQLRLWGANGQKALSESCVILFHPSAAGTESLKNLVLPGIGCFHIVDAETPVNQGDDGVIKAFSNFFVFPEKDSPVPKSRAEIASLHLGELNPDVRGAYTNLPSITSPESVGMVPTDPKEIYNLLDSIRSQHDVEWKNLIIICADIPSVSLQPLADFCWDTTTSCTSLDATMNVSHIPMVIVKSYGLLGSVRIQIPNHPIMETKPENIVPDLRLMSSYQLPLKTTNDDSTTNNGDGDKEMKDTDDDSIIFPELYKLAQKTNLKQLDDQEHSHVPFVILLWKALDGWQKVHNKNMHETSGVVEPVFPKTFQEKQEFRQMIQDMSRDFIKELNFDEAHQNYYLAYSKRDLPFELEQLLSNATTNLKTKISQEDKSTAVTKFDILFAALDKFMSMSKDGLPPLNGSIPDMASDTKSYIELQNVYKMKAEEDKRTMQSIISGFSSDSSKEGGGDMIPEIIEEDLSIFCKNIYTMGHVKTRKFSDEYNFAFHGSNGEEDKEELMGDIQNIALDPFDSANMKQTPFLWYIALRACEAFYEEYGYYPGNDSWDMALETQANTVQKYIDWLVEQMGLKENEVIQKTLTCDAGTSSDYAKEVVRYYNAEVHNIASVVGGIVSQEAVKLITGQYVPMDGTYIFNGIASVAGVYKL